jgi:hypothetical protein
LDLVVGHLIWRACFPANWTVYWQVPSTHPWPETHCVPQEPQFAPSVERSEQVPVQFTVPVGHVHSLSAQIRLPPQTSEQRPQ